MSYENLCMNCMKDIGEEKQCTYCNYKAGSPQLPPFLPLRTIIGGHYLIGNVIEANGDGVTYMAYDTESKTAVTIREFLPDTLITRTGATPGIVVKPGKETLFTSTKSSFLDLYRKLARMRGLSALIIVIDIVEENNTAYAVCEQLEGAVTLRDYLLHRKTGYMSWEEARIMFMPVLSTLSTLHSAGIIHRGISPNTLYVCADHKIRIGGFSISECRNVNSGIAAEIFAGYAPVEQFGVKAQSGPWTDIYAFAAVLYRALIGSTPIESTVRMKGDRMMIPAKFAEQIPAYVINALINALQIMPKDRTKTVDQFRAELSASPTTAIAAEYNGPARPVHQRTSQHSQHRHPTQASQRPSSGNRPARKSGQGQHNRPTGKGTSKSKITDSTKKTAIISGAIAAGIALLIFAILCMTVLKGHIGTGNSNKTTNTSDSAQETVVVPTFTGKTYSSISSQKAFFSDFEITTTEEYSEDVKNGYIISQSVEEGSKVPKGTKISLVISKGTEQITMIDVKNETYDAASAKLTELGFTCKKVDKANTGNATSGTVASTNLNVGEQYDKGTTVILQVWTDVETTTAAEE